MWETIYPGQRLTGNSRKPGTTQINTGPSSWELSESPANMRLSRVESRAVQRKARSDSEQVYRGYVTVIVYNEQTMWVGGMHGVE